MSIFGELLDPVSVEKPDQDLVGSIGTYNICLTKSAEPAETKFPRMLFLNMTFKKEYMGNGFYGNSEEDRKAFEGNIFKKFELQIVSGRISLTRGGETKQYILRRENERSGYLENWYQLDG